MKENKIEKWIMAETAKNGLNYNEQFFNLTLSGSEKDIMYGAHKPRFPFSTYRISAGIKIFQSNPYTSPSKMT